MPDSAPVTGPDPVPDPASDPSARRRLPGWLLPAFAGIASVVLGLGVAELVAAFVAPAASPVLVVG